jgi:hypothetical protein
MLLKIIEININIITWTLSIFTFISQLVKFAGNQFKVQTKFQSGKMLSTGKYPVLNFQAWNDHCPLPVGSLN